MKFLKKIRVASAIFFFLPILLFFIDFTGKLPLQLHKFLDIQLIPALLSLNVIMLIALVVLTLLFGRIYCSTICPLGVYQDIVSWKSRLFRKKAKQYRFIFLKPHNLIRYSILVVTAIVFICGSSSLILLLDPYSTFGRIVSQLVRPLFIMANNGLTDILGKMNNYTLYKVDQVGFVPVALGISIFFFVLVTVMSWFKGRLYCNTICPVGTALGFISKISIFHISIEESNCNNCGLCEKHCKSNCINSDTKKVDDSRCVSCYNCISTCKKGGIKYHNRYKFKKAHTITTGDIDNGRRTFLLASGAVLSTVALANTKKLVTNNEAMLTRKPIMPPGAGNIEHFNKHCTGCQLCVTKCPMHVLKPAALQYGFSGITQPHLVFSTHTFCTYECEICTSVCPTSALRKLPIEEKKRTQIGVAKFRKSKCVVFTDEKDCGACSEHCPTQAVHMIPYKDGLTIPEVTEDICIGCGACESICPARPYQAIYIEGNETQILAKKPAEAEKFDRKIDSFGF
ncbi:ferredoxin-type protein [Paludibacter propionicigenes WB4]|uniref:Ferredoxin-type protein n=1 Tax=Paludibacter propionicigenes (strain DSM 17365 / JCM 13257 / WB4) TaxID=694427 RepID=E4T495_PALPW|nr:4Fe-4S binding protein [Paludibacter propionicigenes]ADQ79539.1 ferredoxin-type protein [Paludibacter propionicigenes WB4]